MSSPPACNLSNRLTLCPYSEEEPELGKLLVSETGWDGFQLTWTATDGAYENFIIQVQETDNPEGSRNITVPGGLRSISVPGLKANTPYNITLHGVIHGYRTRPLSVETMTGIFPSHPFGLVAAFLCERGCEPELLPLRHNACSLGWLCVGCTELIKAWLNISGMERSHDQTFQ